MWFKKEPILYWAGTNIPIHPSIDESTKTIIGILFSRTKHIMAAIETANTNLEQLKTDVTALLAKPAGVPEAQVQAIADAIAALDVTVKAAL